MSLIKTLFPLCSTGLTQEDRKWSRNDCDVKHLNKQTHVRYKFESHELAKLLKPTMTDIYPYFPGTTITDQRETSCDIVRGNVAGENCPC